VKEVEQPRDIQERTFRFALEIFRLCHSLDSKPWSLRVLAQQLLRSGTSVGANVQEAQAGQSRADFISKYSIALKEARETLYWLRLLDASGELSNGSCKALLTEADEIARVIASIIVSAKKGRSSAPLPR
jgi:four helix bundle protein